MPGDEKITLVTRGAEATFSDLKVGSGFCQVVWQQSLDKLPTSAAGRLVHAGGESPTETGVCRQITCSSMGIQVPLLGWSCSS